MKKEALCQYVKSVCTGKQHAKSSRRIEKDLGISGNELRKAVHQLRCNGVPIASCDAGYFYAKNASEIYHSIRQLQKMRSGLDTAIRGLEASLENFGGLDGDPP